MHIISISIINGATDAETANTIIISLQLVIFLASVYIGAALSKALSDEEK